MQVDDKYIYSHCVSPVKIKMLNPLTREVEYREVPCGHCLHCRSTRVSEWVTRMTLQSMYSAYTYFITLTYDSSIIARMCETDERILSELHPTLHDYNEKSRLQLAPLTLCKRHTQLYWKRLRKATDVKIQYYLVGEYGHKYGRPHYHAIVWSDTAISPTQFQDSWIYGNVDVQDVKANSRKTGLDEMTAYKYVCKYLYKDFNFNKIPTINYHRCLYERLSESKESPLQSFEDYVRLFGTFMCCSKSPAIGSAYLQRFLPEFQRGNLRIFGVHGKNLIFPRFYTRKVKESLCPFLAISERSATPRSTSATFNLYADVFDFCSTIADYEFIAAPLREIGEDNRNSDIECKRRLQSRSFHCGYKEYDFYDVSNSVYYLLTSDDTLCRRWYYALYKYDRHLRTYVRCGARSVVDVLQDIEKFYTLLVEKILKPFEASREFREHEFAEYIRCNYSSVEEFETLRINVYDNFMRVRAEQQRKYLQTKNKF